MAIDRRFFTDLMADKRLSLRGLAKKMGMNHSQLSLTFSGSRRPQLDEAAELSRILGEPFHKVVEALGVSVQPLLGKGVRVVGSISGDGTVVSHAPGVVERTPAPDGLLDVEAIQFRTAGSPLEWLDGWVAFYRPLESITPACMGRCCVARIAGGPTVVAAIRRGYKDRTYNLSGPHMRESVALESASPSLATRC